MPANHSDIEERLWDAADELRANSRLKAAEYSVPVLGLIFLRFADSKFDAARKEIEGTSSGRRRIGKTDYQARGVLYLPEESRFSQLLQLTESDDVGKAINDATCTTRLTGHTGTSCRNTSSSLRTSHGSIAAKLRNPQTAATS